MIGPKQNSDLNDQLEKLETRFSDATDLGGQFDDTLKRMVASFSDAKTGAMNLDRAFSTGLRRAMDGVILDGANLTDALGKIRDSLISSAYSAAAKPVANYFGGLLASGVENLVGSVLPFAKGGVLSQGRVQPFAKGGVVDRPYVFPMHGATGLMGEAGPEAIMPLTRGADGRLGVQSQSGGRPISVVMNIQTPDADSFRRSQGQIAAQVGRVLGQAQRNR